MGYDKIKHSYLVAKYTVLSLFWMVLIVYVLLAIEYFKYSDQYDNQTVKSVHIDRDKPITRYLDHGESKVYLDGRTLEVGADLAEMVKGSNSMSYIIGDKTGIVYKAEIHNEDEVSVWKIFDWVFIVTLLVAFTILIPLWNELGIGQVFAFFAVMRLIAIIYNNM